MLYKKKQLINLELYKTHLNNANTLKRTWDNIEYAINTKQHIEMTRKYMQQNQKLDELRSRQMQQMDQKQHQFYPKIHNQSDVHFTEDEIQLLCKGPKYNLH
jgi:hypothetical protein